MGRACGGQPRADCGSSATRRSETDSSSSWKCGRRNDDGAVHARAARHFRHLHARFAQRKLRLLSWLALSSG